MTSDHSPGFLRLVDRAKEEIDELDPDTARPLLSDSKALFVDVREAHEYAQAHVRDALHLSKGVIERDIEEAIPDQGTPLVLYCGGGYRSALAALNLQKMGYAQVYSLAGGIRALRGADYPLVGADPA